MLPVPGRAWVVAVAMVGFLGCPDLLSAATTTTRPSGPSRAAAIIDNGDRMNINNLDMVVTNHGSFAYDLTTGNAGLVYPKGSAKTAVFAGGLWIGGEVNGEARVAIGEYGQEYVPGPMAGGTFQLDQPAFKNFRIARDGTGFADYLAYAVPQGAPVDAQGNPLVLGDATIWSVFNDADPAAHVLDAGGTAPLGVEVQQTVYAFNRSGPLGNVIFLRWKLRNQGANTIENAYVSAWSDPDLGGFTDDLVGCDTTLALGYCYNATNADLTYGATPPAVGFTLLRGPTVERSPGVTDTLGLAAFVKYINGTDPTTALESYNYLRGLHADGTPIHVSDDPAAPVTTYMVSGDPITGTGWLDTSPADRRMQLASGPFRMAPGESRDVLFAIVIGQGANRLASIADLRAKVAALRSDAVTISAPDEVSVNEGETLTFTVSSFDPDGVAALTASTLPPGATFTDHGDGTGLFQWSPQFHEAGDYAVTFTASGELGGTASATTAIHVVAVNLAPVADAGGPYTSHVGVPVAFDGTGSTDADGDPLTFAWEFGDGGSASGPTPSHAYGAVGVYAVALTVSDGALSATATTTATVVERLEARAFPTPGYAPIRLVSRRPLWCVQIEPVGGAFSLTDVDRASIVMRSTGTGAVDLIHATAGKPAPLLDWDRNGVLDMTVSFAIDDVQALFGDVKKIQTVSVTIEGTVIGDGSFEAAMDVQVVATSKPLAASLEPNPLGAGGGTLTFVTDSPGRARVSLFDVSGRLVRRIWERDEAGAGLHRVRLEPRDASGRALASGIYFYRIEAREAVAAGRVLLVR